MYKNPASTSESMDTLILTEFDQLPGKDSCESHAQGKKCREGHQAASSLIVQGSQVAAPHHLLGRIFDAQFAIFIGNQPHPIINLPTDHQLDEKINKKLSQKV